MELIENRNYLRISNQIEILNILRKSDSTLTDIANTLNISFTAAKNICEEMSEFGLIEISDSKQQLNKRGRSPSIVKLNLDNGVVCGIDLSSWDIEVFICTLDCKILCRKSIPSVVFIQREHLSQIKDIIDELLKDSSVEGKKLLSICISSPGMINQDTFKYEDVFRIPDYKDIDPVGYFSNAFGVKVEMFNDIRVGALAELKFGSFPSRPFNGVFLHIGTSCGYAIITDGKIYKGTYGFAGEIASYNEIDVYSKTWAGRIYGIYDILKSEQKDSNRLTLNDNEKEIFRKLMDRYEKKDLILMEKIRESIKMNAISIINLCALLDIEYLVIEGPILQFGKSYTDLLTQTINEYSLTKIRTKIVTSKLQEDSSILGTAYQAITAYMFDSLEKLTRKRLNNKNFKLNKGFYEL